MYTQIKSCRICGNTDLSVVVDLGSMALTGTFPKKKETAVESGPLVLVKCHGKADACGLVQLLHTYDLDQMYGTGYGYRSGLNKSMVRHLEGLASDLTARVNLESGDLVIDIGSNDSTLLQSYKKEGLKLIGIDPSGLNFKQYYPKHIELIPEFFPSQTFDKQYAGRKAKIITSISMFYDLPDPSAFVRSIADRLADDGLWLLEQSYLPTMLEMNSYDTICHEHLEYYALKQIKYMTDRAGLVIHDVRFNAINGGSFNIIVAKKGSRFDENTSLINSILKKEDEMGIERLETYKSFTARIEEHRQRLHDFFSHAREEGKLVLGYGASTKGNVLLQYCNVSAEQIPAIAEVNEDKFGSYTPGTRLHIVSETEAKKMKPDYFMVLPWHFRDNILEREKEFLKSGGRFYFPLPHGEIV